MSLRDYQQDLLKNLRVQLRCHKRVLGVLPTGGGKTRIFCEIAKLARQRGMNVQILVHRRELLDQTPDQQVQTIQSWTPKGEDLVIVDEAHHACARTWREKLLDCDRVLGFTATPQRLDGGGLDAVFDQMVVGPSPAQLIRDGWLSRYKLFCPPGQMDLRGIRKTGGDYSRKQLSERAGDSKTVATAVRNWRLLAGDRQTIGFCVSVAHMQHVADNFKQAGIAVACIEGKMGKSARDDVIAAFRNQKIKILLSVDLISEGFDVPACDCVLLLRPTQSVGLYMQQVGRALRPSDQHAIILDCAGNCERHGLPDDERIWSLAGTNKERGGLVANLAVRTCPQCYGVHKPHLRTCPYCGYAHPLDARIPAEANILLQEQIQVKKDMRRAVGRARSVEELESIARERGYSMRWVDHVLKSRNARRY